MPNDRESARFPAETTADSPPPTTPRVWFVTGGGRGIGRAIVDAALAAGDDVVVTVRDRRAVDDLVARRPDHVHVEQLDVRDEAAARRSVDAGVARFGRLDVVVNNAGYGLIGTIEEVAPDEARRIIDTNLLGALWVSQAAVAHMRGQGSGHIVQISTVGGVGTMPTLGLYNASKWALEGFSEALAAEVARFGIRVTIAELGGFATDWAGASMAFAAPLAAYDELRTELFGTAEVPWPVATPDASADATDAPASDAPTDAPASAAAAAILAHVGRPDGPRRLLVGDDAPGHVAMALDARRVDYLLDPRFTWPA